ncbi:phage major capsid protein [Clostridium estertheticum]|uniref:Phage major capsid protein n=1 Tax=Clostridium estertheticum TaxID=238834 RepID=A0AA47EJE5_9CLOT|nr:phage major capsid protein [Clostridium estertheticum]MBU3153902.1 phage major capsid protein [Clostridium estertheticum]WAG61322.1 phage major capsid protein [Clostridium estertheticum]
MNITEMRAKIGEMKVEVRTLLESDVTLAGTKMEEVRNLEKALKLQIELGEEEKRDILDQSKNKKDGVVKMEKVNEMRAITKQLMGKELTPEERSAIMSSDNAVLIPKQLIMDVIKLSTGYGSLKGICAVIPVVKNEGSIPVVDISGQNALLTVVEGDAIIDGKLVSTDLKFKCSKVGLIQELTSESVDDAEVEIESLIRENFVEISVSNENAKILNVVKTNAVAVVATGYEDIDTAIDSALPSVKANLATITNVTGYCHIKAQKDLTSGKKLDLITMVGTQEYYYGHPIYVVEDTLLPIAEGKTQVYYVGNFKEAVKYFDRNQFTVAKSTEAGFNTDTVKLRILKRFDVTKGSIRSLKKIEF